MYKLEDVLRDYAEGASTQEEALNEAKANDRWRRYLYFLFGIVIGAIGCLYFCC